MRLTTKLLLCTGLAIPGALQASTTPSGVSATCLGDPAAMRKIIFLRGITEDVDPAETWRLGRFRRWPKTILRTGIFDDKEYYEAQLLPIARKLHSRIALLESNRFCTGSLTSHCWAGDQPGSIASTYADVVAAAGRCFPVKDDGFDLFGFSNGGYHVGRVLMQCLSPRPARAFAFGSAGDPRLAISADLARCTRSLTLAIGDLDQTNAKAKVFADEMRARKLDVRFIEFYGGHELPPDVLERVLQ